MKYDAIITSLGFETRSFADKNGERPAWAQPSVGDMIGTMRMEPKRGTDAPVAADKRTGRVVVAGFAAGDALNIATSSESDEDSDARLFKVRGDRIKNKTSADSPDERVVEGVGMTARQEKQ